MQNSTFLFLLFTFSQLFAQKALTPDDYDRASRFLRSNTNKLVTETVNRPAWLDDNRLVYQKTIINGFRFITADPLKHKKSDSFNHARLASALSVILKKEITPFNLPFRSFKYVKGGSCITFTVSGKSFECDLETYKIKTIKSKRRLFNEVVSLDGKKSAFIRDYNLWFRCLETGKETQLTFDGVENFGYATNNAGWTKGKGPVLLWSPGSDKIATFQHDSRGVGDMYLVSTNVGHPKLEAWKCPLPGDSLIFRMSRVVIHLKNRRVVRLKMPADPHRSTISDHVAGRGGKWLDVEWSKDGKQLGFVSTSRDHKHEVLRIADAETGKVRDILKEDVDTFFESGYNMVNWHILNESNEVIWFSERDDRGHLYLYNLETGKLKHQITKGDWSVLQLRRIDRNNRKLYFTAGGRDSSDPYFQQFYSIGMDGKNLNRLTPEDADHKVVLSPDGKYFIDTYSTPVFPPVSVIRKASGPKTLSLEKADISALLAIGWKPPVPFKVKARDGKTDIYGLMYLPVNLDPEKKYPVLNPLYPGPQSGSVGSRSFRAARGDKQAVSELGFIVVEVDALGTPGRSKSFHCGYYGNMGDNGLPDQIAAIKQLADRYAFFDIDRVGIYGHSGGGFASTAGILRYPDFYKVAVSGSGNHDNRNYEDDWGEKWQGMLSVNQDGSTNYDNQANQLLAENLVGKLLIAHGTMDNNVPPSNTMLVVNALIDANKDFDLLLFPNSRHGYRQSKYWMRKRWDYFVRYLLGVEPPKEYVFK